MDVFIIGLITLAAISVVFYGILFGFIFYWHLKRVSIFVVPLVFTFEFFVAGFLIVSIISIIINLLPGIIQATKI